MFPTVAWKTEANFHNYEDAIFYQDYAYPPNINRSGNWGRRTS